MITAKEAKEIYINNIGNWGIVNNLILEAAKRGEDRITIDVYLRYDEIDILKDLGYKVELYDDFIVIIWE